MKPHAFLLLSALASAMCAPAAFAQPAPPARPADDAYRAAYALVLGERWADAERALGAFLTTNGSAEKADDAGFWRCYAVEKQGRLGEAFGCYNGFVQGHPDTEWRDDTEGRLIGLASALAPGQAVTVYGAACNAPGVVCEATASDGQGTAVYYPSRGVDRTAPARGTDRTPGSVQAPATTVWHSATAPADYVTGAADHAVGSADYAAYLRRQRANPDERVAILAVQALAQPGRDDVVDDLRRLATESTSEAVRSVAAGGLARVGTPNARAALAALTEAALDEAADAGAGSPAERRAVDLIGEAARPGDATLAPALDRALRNDRLSAAAREMAARGLGQIGTDAAVEALVAFIEEGGNDVLRAEALEGLNLRHVTAWAARLLALFERTREPDLRSALARTLATMVVARDGWTVLVSATEPGAAVGGYYEPNGVLRALPSNAVQRTRRAAPDTVALARVRAALLATLEAGDTPGVHRSALQVLGARTNESDIALLERFAARADAREDIRAYAVDRISQAGSPAAFAALRRLAERLDGRPLAALAYVFGSVFSQNPEAVPVLVRLARHADADVRRAAINALGRIEAPAARQALLDLIRTDG